MRVLLTGINGFVGTYTANFCRDAGYTVLGIGRQESCRIPIHEYYQFSLGDMENFEGLSREIGNFDAMIHLAADLSMNFWDARMLQSNLVGTHQAYSLASTHGCKILIFMSSIGVYGAPEEETLSEESSPCCQTLYHYTKLWGEQMLERLCDMYPNLRVVIFRMTSPIGCGMRKQTFLPTVLERCLKNEPVVLYGKGERVQNYIDVRDVVSAIDLALQSNSVGMFNLGGSKSYSNIQVAELCRELCDSKSKVVFQKDDPQEQERWVLDQSKIKAQLHFVPKYELRDTLQWMVNGD